jgi:hypothetical protein
MGRRSYVGIHDPGAAHKAWAGCAKTRKQADNLSVRASTNGADYIAIIKKE